MVKSERPSVLPGIRILMMAPCLGKFGGIETFCLTLIEDLIKRGAFVRLLRKRVLGFSNDNSVERTETEIIEQWSSDQRSRFSSEYVNRGEPQIKKAIQESDLVHLHNPMVEGVWLAKKNRIPCVMTIYNWRRKGLHPRLLAWRWAARNADRRWYISEFVWDSWESKRKKGSARLPVVSKMPTGEVPSGERRGFLFAGRWIPNKGLRILLKAYHRLAPNPETWPLILLGDGPLRPEVERIAKESGVKGVRLLGFVSEEERIRRTREAKWMVTPPHTREDLGLTPLEARSAGVPCIVSRDGGVKETGGPHALLCEPGSVESLEASLKKAMEMSEDEYEQMRNLAKVGLDEYVRSLDEYAEEYLKLLGMA
jgi:glycosyltransferase involved in cell wall biosynthesis